MEGSNRDPISFAIIFGEKKNQEVPGGDLGNRIWRQEEVDEILGTRQEEGIRDREG